MTTSANPSSMSIPSQSLPPTSTSTPSSSSPDSLSTQLDDLLIQYLSLLDTYTILRTTLSTQFSSGFFSLAQAQRHCNLGPGRRYGEDCYDERMKAVRGIKIAVPQDDEDDEQPRRGEDREPVYRFTIRDLTSTSIGESLSTASIPKSEMTTGIPTPQPSHPTSSQDSTQPYPTPRQTPEPLSIISSAPKTSNNINTTSTPSTTANTTTSSTTRKHRDPIAQFSPFPPPSLRQSETHFKSALPTMSSLLTTMTELQHLEKRIRSLRQEMELEG